MLAAKNVAASSSTKEEFDVRSIVKHFDPVRHVRFGNGNAGVFHFDPLTATDQRHSTRVIVLAWRALSMSLGDFSAQSVFVTAVALCDFSMPPCWALSTIRWSFSILIYVFFGGVMGAEALSWSSDSL